MDAHKISASETTPASRKLGKDEADGMLTEASVLVVAKGKKVRRWELTGKPDSEATAAMLGPTGNLRAPTIRFGKTVLVGFNEEVYGEILG
jgi:arsenate reductase-like glutaredoxin family protein